MSHFKDIKYGSTAFQLVWLQVSDKQNIVIDIMYHENVFKYQTVFFCLFALYKDVPMISPLLCAVLFRVPWASLPLPAQPLLQGCGLHGDIWVPRISLWAVSWGNDWQRHSLPRHWRSGIVFMIKNKWSKLTHIYTQLTYDNNIMLSVPQCMLAQPCYSLSACVNTAKGFSCEPCPYGFRGPFLSGVGLEYAKSHKQVNRSTITLHIVNV